MISKGLLLDLVQTSHHCQIGGPTLSPIALIDIPDEANYCRVELLLNY